MLDPMTGSAAYVANGRQDILATNTLGWAPHSPMFDARSGRRTARASSSSTRGRATTSDVLKTFIQSDGLVVGTRALDTLLRAVQDDTALARPIRQRLREARGVLRASDADNLLADIRKPTD
jgi:hypothetical protein